MAGTGLFLCLFLVGHLAGNLQLLLPVKDGAADTFNAYAHFMTTNPLVKILSYLTYFSILFHAVDGILLTIENRKARPVAYAYNNANANSKPQSRYMALLGTLILVFIVIHMVNFWARMHFGELPNVLVKGIDDPVKDLYTIVIVFFKHPDFGLIASLLYALSMLVLAFHLSHGFKSAFQSLGIYHAKWTPVIKNAGLAFSILVPLLFAVIPLYIHFGMTEYFTEETVKEILEWLSK